MNRSAAMPAPVAPLDEEDVVAALEAYGVSYLSRSSRPGFGLGTARGSPEALLEAILQQPSARVRSAIIALLIVQPRLWHAADALQGRLIGEARDMLMLFYTAARILQQMHIDEIRAHGKADGELLPDLFGTALGLPKDGSPETQLKALAAAHRRTCGRPLNWEGTYRSAVGHLLRQWQMEAASENASLVDGYRDTTRYVLARADDRHFTWRSGSTATPSVTPTPATRHYRNDR